MVKKMKTVFATIEHMFVINVVFWEPGGDVNRQTTTNDHTVLSLACAGGHLTVVELLLAYGADPTHKLKVSWQGLVR